MLCLSRIAAYSFQVVYELSLSALPGVPPRVFHHRLRELRALLLTCFSQQFSRGYYSAPASAQTFVFHGRSLSIS